MIIKEYKNKEVLVNILKDNGYYIGMKLKDKETGKIGALNITQQFYFYPIIQWYKKDGTVSDFGNYKRISKSYNIERIIYALKNYYEIIKED